MDVEVLRATETWQQAGAYYVRIQATPSTASVWKRRSFRLCRHVFRIGPAKALTRDKACAILILSDDPRGGIERSIDR